MTQPVCLSRDWRIKSQLPNEPNVEKAKGQPGVSEVLGCSTPSSVSTSVMLMI